MSPPIGPDPATPPLQAGTAPDEAAREYRDLFNRNPAPMVIYERSSLSLMAVNDAFVERYGYSHEEASQLTLMALYAPEDRPAVAARAAQLHGLHRFGEWRQMHKSGSFFDIVVQSHDIVYDGRDCRVAVGTDVTPLKRAQRRDRSRLALLENLGRGDSLPRLLEQLARDHEALFVGSLCCIQLLDKSGQRLLDGASPSLPGFVRQAMEGQAIGPEVCCSGAAVHGGQRVLVDDIASHPNWAGHRQLAAQAGLGACWSEPIVGAHGRALGCVSVYRREPAQPSTEELEHLGFSAQLASTAIAHWATARQLQSSDQQLQDLLHAIPDLVWLKDPQGVYQSCNAAFERLIGKPASQIIGRTDAELLAAGTATSLGASDQAVISSGQARTSEHWLNLAGEAQPALFEAIKTPLRGEHGQLTGVLGVARDITLIKRGARAIAEQERLVDTMFSQTTDSIVLVDPQTQGFVTFNDAACRGLGYTREAFSRLTPMDIQNNLGPEEILSRSRRALAGEALRFETTHRRADGSLQSADMTLRMLAYGGRTLLSAVWRDISEGKQHAARIERLNQAYAVLSGVNEAIVRIRDTTALYAEACRIAVEVGGFRAAWVGELDAASHAVVPVAQAGHSDGYVEAVDIRMDGPSGPTLTVLTTGRPCVANDLAQDPAMLPWRAGALARGYRASAGFPIRVGGQPRACLSVYSGTPDHFDDAQVSLFSRLTENLGFALELTAAESARLAEQRFREQLIESVAGLFYAVDAAGRVVLWNRRFEEVSRCAPEEIRSRALVDFFAGTDRALITQHLQDVFSTGDAQGEAWLTGRDGRRTPYLFVSRRIELAPEPLVVTTGIDISDRVRSAQELEVYRAHLEDLVTLRTAELESVNERLHIEDHRLRAMLALTQKGSAMTEQELLQVGVDEVARLARSQAACLHAVNAEPGQAILQTWSIGMTPRLREATWGAEAAPPWRLAMERGQTVVVEGTDASATAPAEPGPHRAMSVPIFDDGLVCMVVCAINKATPFDDADERDLQLIGADLWRIVRRRRVEVALERAKRDADAASLAKSAFLANMSHEIRTPMNAIIGFAHLMGREALSSRQRDHLNRISEAGRHLLQVINDILDFSKIEARKISLEAVDFAPHESIERVVGMVADKARDKQLPIRLHLADCPPWLHGDSLRLEQILLNLLSNAVKFTQHGHIDVRAQPVSTDARRLLMRFEVEDTGIGLPAAQTQHLFQAFEQADGSTTRRFGGTGLGLAISKRLAELMGGSIGLHSVPGQGSRFWVELPFRPADTAALADRSVQPAPHTPAHPDVPPEDTGPEPVFRGARVLLVEDNPVNQEVATELLAVLGLSVEVAENGQVAVDMVGRTAYDLIIMDVQMPVMDGLLATAAIRALPARAGVPIIAMTANAFDEDRSRCLAAGMNDFLPKPVEPGQLRRCLLRWLAPAALLRPMPAAQTAAPPQARVEALVDLDAASALGRMSGNWSLYLRILQLFVSHHTHDAARLREADLAADLPAQRQLAHTLEGAAATIGAHRLQAQAHALSAAIGRHADGQPDAGAASSLADDLERLLGCLTAALGGEPVLAPVSAPDREATVQALDRLRPLLAAHDTSASEAADGMAPLLERTLGDQARTLKSHIDNFSFESALQTLDEAVLSLQRVPG